MDNYEPSGSEDEYTENEKLLLSKIRSRKEYSDSEDEVFGVGGDDDEDDDDDNGDKSDLALSDVEGQVDDGDLPDIRAWGKDKRKYYSTDYVDPDYGGFQGKDAQLAELEEEEARNLQKQLAQQLDDDDFSLDVFTKRTEEDKKQPEEIIKTDISKLSKRQKLQILKKESPEFFGLVEDFEAKMLIAKDYLHPILQKYKKGQIPSCKAIDFVQTQYELILNYTTNIYMYLLLKSSKINVRNHPIVKRLYQYRQLLSQLEPVYEEIVKPQLEIMLVEKDCSGEEIEEERARKTKTLKLLSTLTQKTKQLTKNKKDVIINEGEKPSKKIKVDNIVIKGSAPVGPKTDIGLDNAQLESSENEDEKEQESEKNQQNNEQYGVSKRAITYEMAKNKGLTPHRKKEQRNPRVKHRLRYRKAIIRRKGAVREPRKELSRYSGEISGINASVSKSIKIKA